MLACGNIAHPVGLQSCTVYGLLASKTHCTLLHLIQMFWHKAESLARS